MQYSKERKEAVLKKMMPPHNRSIIELAREEDLRAATLYLWRREARKRGLLLPDSDRVPEGCNARDSNFRSICNCLKKRALDDFVFANPTTLFSCPLFIQSDPLRELLRAGQVQGGC